ncbi:hypothetical protein DPMN_186383 [Dreissena polymorpha]|uniref:Uncharacterized protein n=1 Tax=Dreissena polymorpha TaxID=45954 RepID=A0A9D4I853_DREPO|nr:hypothetical protein DPMN_186383 [Dreissena polymorpha]
MNRLALQTGWHEPLQTHLRNKCSLFRSNPIRYQVIQDFLVSSADWVSPDQTALNAKAGLWLCWSHKE